MSTAKSIMGIIPGLQATALVGENLKLVKNTKNYKKGSTKFLKTGVKNLVGIGMITPTAQMINALD